MNLEVKNQKFSGPPWGAYSAPRSADDLLGRFAQCRFIGVTQLYAFYYAPGDTIHSDAPALFTCMHIRAQKYFPFLHMYISALRNIFPRAQEKFMKNLPRTPAILSKLVRTPPSTQFPSYVRQTQV